MSAAREATKEARALLGWGAYAFRQRHVDRSKRCVVVGTSGEKGVAWFGASFAEVLEQVRAAVDAAKEKAA